MSLLKKYIDGYTAQNSANKKMILNDILLLNKPIQNLFSILEDETEPNILKRQCVNVLCDISLKPAYAKKIFKIFTPDYALKVLKYDDPKIRKACARLCGIANRKEYSVPLIFAIENEQTMYVLDSLILALGYTDYSKRALDFLKSYKPKSIEKKHLDNETTAIKKAISSLTRFERLDDVALDGKDVVLTYCQQLEDALKNEMDEYCLPYNAAQFYKNSLIVKPKDYKDVFGLRCFFEALIHIGEFRSGDDVAFSQKIIDELKKLFNMDKMSFRLDLRYPIKDEKNQKVKRITELLENSNGFLTCSTSNYQFELRLVYSRNKINAYVNIPSIDNRFSYRKNTIAASINPVVAASIIRTISKYLKRDATVLDPFCGTGTLLYERDYIMPCEELIGVDMNKNTVSLAKENFYDIDMPISFVNSNILNCKFGQQFDEVICNMPFGRRVSKHDSNEKMYISFIDMLDVILKDYGYAFLYTNEKILLQKALRKHKQFEILDEMVIESGGLYPSLYIIKKMYK